MELDTQQIVAAVLAELQRTGQLPPQTPPLVPTRSRAGDSTMVHRPRQGQDLADRLGLASQGLAARALAMAVLLVLATVVTATGCNLLF